MRKHNVRLLDTMTVTTKESVSVWYVDPAEPHRRFSKNETSTRRDGRSKDAPFASVLEMQTRWRKQKSFFVQALSKPPIPKEMPASIRAF